MGAPFVERLSLYPLAAADRAPANDDGAPANDDRVPASHDRAPASHDPVPVSHDRVPASHDPVPANDDRVRANDDGVPRPQGGDRTARPTAGEPPARSSKAIGGALRMRFRAHGEGLYPLIRDGDLVVVEAISAGDNGNRISGTIAAGHLAVLRDAGGAYSAALVGPGLAPSAAGGAVVGRVVAAGRVGGDERPWGNARRLLHLVYLAVWPLSRALIAARRGASLLDPRAFVGDAEASLRSVRHKYDDGEEIDYCVAHAGDGLTVAEERLADRYLGNARSILCVGCGAGREAFALAALGHDVLGVDSAPGMISAARRLAGKTDGNARFAVRDAADLGAEIGAFDCVLLGDGVYSLIPGRRLRIETLRRAAALLRPGGVLVIFPLLRRRARLSRVAIHSAIHRFAGRWLGRRKGPEPGDVMRRHVSPVGDPSRLCYVHLFTGSAEVAGEIRAAGLAGVEDATGGFWVIRASDGRGSRVVGASRARHAKGAARVTANFRSNQDHAAPKSDPEGAEPKPDPEGAEPEADAHHAVLMKGPAAP